MERGLKLYACVDNDEAGIKFTADNGLIPCNRILIENGVKDYNELLQLITHNREMSAQNLTTVNNNDVQNSSKTAQTVKHTRR